jgi:RNA polymerase sigma-70 factor (ECF subfamily)
MSALPEKLREVLVLTYFQGLTSREISERIDIPIGTVKSRVRAAREALRTALGDGSGGKA